MTLWTWRRFDLESWRQEAAAVDLVYEAVAPDLVQEAAEDLVQEAAAAGLVHLVQKATAAG
jgi:pyrroloquinoline quinone (PQQ) biosynthesis protein C